MTADNPHSRAANAAANEVVAAPNTAAANDSPFRFFDNREKYLLFVTTCNEKQVIAERVAMDTAHLHPTPPALRVFDAGMGDASVLTRVMMNLHHRFPTAPMLVVGKEISYEDVRISLEKMPDRLVEHPLTAIIVTNMLYAEAPQLQPRGAKKRARLNWAEFPLEGNTAHDFSEQITAIELQARDWWRTEISPRSGNPIYAAPAAMVIYRKDQAWPLAPIIPQRPGAAARVPPLEYDLVIAAQPFRARQSARQKVRSVLAPLAQSLARDGLMVVIQSTGKDPGMEIVRRIWAGERPFRTPRAALLRELREQVGAARPDLRYISYVDSRAEFQYFMQLSDSGGAGAIGTSALLAAWNAAVYVAQIDDERLHAAMRGGEWLDVTAQALRKYGGLWFTDESFIVTRV